MDDFDEPDPDFGLLAKNRDREKVTASAVSFKDFGRSDMRYQEENERRQSYSL